MREWDLSREIHINRQAVQARKNGRKKMMMMRVYVDGYLLSLWQLYYYIVDIFILCL